MKKINEYVCPMCGNDIDNETIDVYEDIDCMTKVISCGKCSCVWHEYFKMIYDGYAYHHKVYDTNGDIVED